MKLIKCDECGKIIEGWNFGRKWITYKWKEWSVVVKVGDGKYPQDSRPDICQDCLIKILKKSKPVVIK